MRKASPRSQSGCLNCRRRHLKCGEEKPICKRCVQYGSSECIESTNLNLAAGSGGSFHSFSIHHNTPPSDSTPAHQWLMKKVLDRETISRSETDAIRGAKPLSRKLLKLQEKERRFDVYGGELTYVLLTSTPGISFQVPGCENERRLFRYFQLETIPDISGYSNHDFWFDSILSWSHQEPVLRYAIIAFASFHESQRLNLQSIDQHPISLRHYNKAIRAVQNLMIAPNKQSRQVILTCCLLFILIESVRGGFEDEVKHLNAGLAMLKEASARSKLKSRHVPIVDAEIFGLFARLDGHYSLLDNYRPTTLVLTTANERNGKKLVVPTAFSNIRDVQTICTKITNWAYSCLLLVKQSTELYGRISPSIRQEIHSLSLAHDQVEPAFAPLRNRYIAQAMTERTCLRESVASIALAVSFLGSRIGFDDEFGFYFYQPSERREDHFDKILVLVETLTKIYKTNSYGPEKLEPRTFFLVRGIVSVTMLIALTAKEELTRERGLNVMKQWPSAAGTPEEIFDGNRLALAIEAVDADCENTAFGKGRPVPRCRDQAIVEVISSLRRRAFLWVGEISDFALEELAPLFGFRPCFPTTLTVELPREELYKYYCTPKP